MIDQAIPALRARLEQAFSRFQAAPTLDNATACAMHLPATLDALATLEAREQDIAHLTEQVIVLQNGNIRYDNDELRERIAGLEAEVIRLTAEAGAEFQRAEHAESLAFAAQLRERGAELLREQAESRLTARSAALRELIEAWRTSAAFPPQPWDTVGDANRALGQCADQLAQLVAATEAT